MVAIRFDTYLALGLAINVALLTACSTVKPTHRDPTPGPMSSMVGEGHVTEAKILNMDPDGCTWVAATGGVRFGDQDTKH